MDNDYGIEDIIVQRGVTLLGANERDRPALASAFDKTGVLSFRKFRKNKVHFFHWRALEVMETGTQVNTATTSTATLYLLFKDLSGLEYTEDNELSLQANDRFHSKYQFKESLVYRVVEFLGRMGFIRSSDSLMRFHVSVKEAEPSVLAELSKDLVTRLDSVQHLLPFGRTVRPTLANRLPMSRGKLVDAREWTNFFDSDGVTPNPVFVKNRIFRGGVADEIRREAWTYLLGLNKWENSKAENEARRRVKSEEYYRMKQQTIQAIQERHSFSFQERICAIEKDAKQTDITIKFYDGPDNLNRDMLRNILLTFQTYHFDLCYASGMAELAAPILRVIQTEADAYWCFAGFMEKVIDNFDLTKAEMKLQRQQLLTLLAFVNRSLYLFLTENAAGNEMYFCCRWFEVWFKKDFTYPHAMLLWEVLWTGVPCQNFHLFVCAAILEHEMRIITHKQLTNHDKLVNHLVDIAGKLDVKAVLMNAESIYTQMLQTLNVYPDQFMELRSIFRVY